MSIPRVLNGRYEIGELLGRGGMADVYKAFDARLGRTVAVKLLRGDVGRDAVLQSRFRREAQAVAGLNHPSIVAVYDTGEHAVGELDGDGAQFPYIVMEYVHGLTLRELIRTDGVTIDHAIDYTLGVLSALEYSHRAGIVHRDIKPANVMVTQGLDGRLGDVKVMDFGIARTISDSAATMTQTQTVMGTAQYLSPEQARGESVDARSDLYSAACLFYELLAGRPPFKGDSPVSVAYQHVREIPPAPSTFNAAISPALDSIVLRALQKDRKDRFQDAASFRRALRAARTGVTLAPAPPAPPTELVAAVGPALTASVSTAPVPTVSESAVSGSTAAGSTAAGSTAPIRQAQGMAANSADTRAMAKVMAGGSLTSGDEREAGALQEPDRAVKTRRRAWIITLFVFLAVILAGGAYLGYNLMNAKPAAIPHVSVPVLAGLSENSAVSKLIEMRLKPEVSHEFSTSVAAGAVISSDPRAGASIEENSVVNVVVSKGRSEVTIPTTLAGRTESEVRAELAALGLKFKFNDFVDDPEIRANLVVTSDPKPGETVAVGTEITLKISNGQVTLPSLFDLSKDPAQVRKMVTDAVALASPLLQVVFVEEENSAVTPGMVIRQSPAAGTQVLQRSTVTVTLAKAPPEPVVPVTPKPTPTPTPTPKPSTPPVSKP